MKMSDVVRMALVKGQKKQIELGNFLGLSSPAAMGNKLARDSWSADDLAKVAAFTGGKLVIRYQDGIEIAVLPEDIE